MAGRLRLRRGRDTRCPTVGIRGRIPDTIHVYRAVVLAIPSPDDCRVISESRIRVRSPRRRGKYRPMTETHGCDT